MIFQCKYKEGGREFPNFDCYGFVKWLYEKEHKTVIQDFDYKDPDDPTNEKYFIECMNNPKWVKVKPQKGAVVPLRVNGRISHIGYMISDTEFVHIMKESGVVIAKITSDKWKNRIVGFYKQ